MLFPVELGGGGKIMQQSNQAYQLRRNVGGGAQTRVNADSRIYRPSNDSRLLAPTTSHTDRITIDFSDTRFHDQFLRKLNDVYGVYTDVSELHVAFISSVDECRMGDFLCIYSNSKKKNK
jgi:hypothetical protein